MYWVWGNLRPRLVALPATERGVVSVTRRDFLVQMPITVGHKWNGRLKRGLEPVCKTLGVGKESELSLVNFLTS